MYTALRISINWLLFMLSSSPVDWHGDLSPEPAHYEPSDEGQLANFSFQRSPRRRRRRHLGLAGSHRFPAEYVVDDSLPRPWFSQPPVNRHHTRRRPRPLPPAEGLCQHIAPAVDAHYGDGDALARGVLSIKSRNATQCTDSDTRHRALFDKLSAAVAGRPAPGHLNVGV